MDLDFLIKFNLLTSGHRYCVFCTSADEPNPIGLRGLCPLQVLTSDAHVHICMYLASLKIYPICLWLDAHGVLAWIEPFKQCFLQIEEYNIDTEFYPSGIKNYRTFFRWQKRTFFLTLSLVTEQCTQSKVSFGTNPTNPKLPTNPLNPKKSPNNVLRGTQSSELWYEPGPGDSPEGRTGQWIVQSLRCPSYFFAQFFFHIVCLILFLAHCKALFGLAASMTYMVELSIGMRPQEPKYGVTTRAKELPCS